MYMLYRLKKQILSDTMLTNMTRNRRKNPRIIDDPGRLDLGISWQCVKGEILIYVKVEILIYVKVEILIYNLGLNLR